MIQRALYSLRFFFNDTATTEIYTLSLHDALPIFDFWLGNGLCVSAFMVTTIVALWVLGGVDPTQRSALLPLAWGAFAGLADRKSTRLNSSHGYISYAVFCLNKKSHPQ